jgi:MFS family permease
MPDIRSPDVLSVRPSPLPIGLIVGAALGIALNIGAARFTYGVMLPSLRRDLALDYFAGGALNANQLLGHLIGTLVAPQFARGMTMARLSALAFATVAAGALLCALAPQTPVAGVLVLGAGRLITGLGAGGGTMAVMVIVFAAVSAERRSLASAIVWSGMGIATILSGLAAPLLLANDIGWRTAFGLTGLLALAIAVAFPPRGSEKPAVAAEPLTSSQFAARQLAEPRWLFLLAAYFTFAFAYIAWSTFAGAQLAATGAPMLVVQSTWIVFGAATMAGAALTVPLAASAHLRHYALSISFVLAAPGALLSAFDAGWASLTGALLVGLGAGATPTIVSALARERCRAEDYARVFAYTAAALGVGQLLGPLVAGRFADIFGTVAVPLLAAAAYAAGAALAVRDGWISSRLH